MSRRDEKIKRERRAAATKRAPAIAPWADPNEVARLLGPQGPKLYPVARILRKQYAWPQDYLRKQLWGVRHIIKQLGGKHDVEWLARHANRQLGPIYLTIS